MNEKPESGLDRLKKFALYQWGLLAIFGGVIANLLLQMQATSGGPAAVRRAEALGRGVATMLFILVGVVLIVVDVVRRMRRSG